MTTHKSILLPGLALTLGLSLPAQGPQDQAGGNHLVGGPSSVMRQAHGAGLRKNRAFSFQVSPIPTSVPWKAAAAGAARSAHPSTP